MDFDFVPDEISRNLPDDVDFERDNLKVMTECTQAGENLLNANTASGFITGIFNGATSKCLVDSYVSKVGKEAVLLATSFVVNSMEDSSEIGLNDNANNKLKREVVRIFKQNDLFLVSVDQDQYGSSIVDQLLDSQVIKFVLDKAEKVFVFHSEPISKFRGSTPSKSLYYIKTSTFQKEQLELARSIIQPLPMPNLIEEFSAAVLSYCEMIDKPCVLTVSYTEFGDSGSHIPTIQLIRSIPSLTNRLPIPQDFSLRTKVHSTILYNSNLFI